MKENKEEDSGSGAEAEQSRAGAKNDSEHVLDEVRPLSLDPDGDVEEITISNERGTTANYHDRHDRNYVPDEADPNEYSFEHRYYERRGDTERIGFLLHELLDVEAPTKVHVHLHDNKAQLEVFDVRSVILYDTRTPRTTLIKAQRRRPTI